MPICIYAPLADDFTTNGLGILTPLECTVEEQAAGMYELEMVHPIDNTLRWMQIQNGCIVKVPAPVRENPLYEAPAIIQSAPVTVTRQVWRATDGQHIRSAPKSNSKKLGSVRKGQEVIELEDAADPWKKISAVNGGQVGYMSTRYLKAVRTVEEVIEPAKPVASTVINIGQSREQLFRIYSVEQDSESATVTAKGMHVFYDDAGNLINAKYEPSKTALATVMNKINYHLHSAAEVNFQAIALDGKITGDFSYKTPVEAYLDPDEGIVAQTNAMLVRDNWEAYLLPDMVRDMGVTIRRGKNLIGVEVSNDISDVVTRIIPIGKNKKGDPIGLTGTSYVDSSRINEYPFPRIKRVEYDVQTGKDGFNSDTAVRNELKRLAQEEFKNGVDLPTYGMEVDFVLLQNTAEYANFASLQAVHLYDTVTVIDEMLGLKAKVRVTGYKWDCLAQQYESVTLGELQDLNQTVYSFNLPNGGVSGNKIMNNSLSGSAMRDASIEYAKITVAAIEQLSANAITALTARIQEIVSQKITTDELYAAYAEMIALKVGSIDASNIETDALAAELARITVLAAGTAEFDKATIQHLVAQAMNLEYGVAGQVFIKNLGVEYAQMVSATVGDLCIKASDGNYYLMDVSPDGTVTATKTTVSSGEASAGQTSGGKVILETNITAANLNTGNLLATYALINQIDAARIDVDQLFAREAFVTLLRTSKIVGEKSITMLAGEVEEMERLSSVEVIEGTFAQAERKEGEGIHVFSEVKPKQSDSGNPSPSNIRPIEGYTKLNAALAQKNLLSCAAAEEIANNGITVVSDGKGTYTINGTATGAANCTFALQQPCYIPVGKTIYCHHLNNVANGNIAVGFMDDVKQHSYMSTSVVNRIQQITLLNGVTITRLNFYIAKGQTVENMKVSTMLMLTNEPSEYAPYQGGLYTISFEDAVYGGTVDWAAGEMTATMKCIILTGNENWVNYGSGLPMYYVPDKAKNDGTIVSSHLVQAKNYTEIFGVQNSARAVQNGIAIHWKNIVNTTDFTTFKAEIKAEYDAGTPVQVCYELAEPYIIQLTPAIIESLDGLNTVYTDADGGRVEFGHSQIDSMLNSIEALEEAQRESALYLKLDSESKVVRIGQTEITSEFDIDAYGAGVVVNGETFSRFEGSRVLIGDMEMRKPANVGGLAFDSIMREVFR